jgi:hypothetical protein
MATIFRHFKQKSGAGTGSQDGSNTATRTGIESPITIGDEKHDHEVAVSGDGAGHDEPDDLEEDVREIPLAVRRIVSLEDDTTLPTITFR